jgi:tetratricopeptide (TPR) repeat protein
VGWRKVLGRAAVTHVIAYDPSARWQSAEWEPLYLRDLFGSPAEWEPLYLRGCVMVFAWRPPGRPGPVAGLKVPPLDLRAWAFWPPEEQRAPAEGPGREPEPRNWWEAFYAPLPQPVPDRDEVLVHLTAFKARRPAFHRQRRRVWQSSLAAGTVGTQALAGGLPGNLAGAGLRCNVLGATVHPGFLRKHPWLNRLATEWTNRFHEASPPGALLLAVRAARRALRANPDDALAQLRLGEAYLALLRLTRERAAAPGFPELQRLRTVQAITALKDAVRLKPDLAEAHADLATIYLEMNALDLALEHREHQLKSTRAAGPRPEEDAAAFGRRLKALEEDAARLGKEVRAKTNLFETRAFGKDVLDKAQIAESVGLPGAALDILLKSSYRAFGREGAALELQLLLSTGRTREVREWMEPEQAPHLGRANYYWIQALLAAARGDYTQAGQDLRRVAPARVNLPLPYPLPLILLRDIPPRQAIALLAGQLVQEELAKQPLVPRMGWKLFRQNVFELAATQRQLASLTVLGGLLALEQGESEEAARLLRRGIELWDDGTEGPASLARHYLGLIEAARPRSR